MNKGERFEGEGPTPPPVRKGLSAAAYLAIALLVLAIILLASGVVKMSPL